MESIKIEYWMLQLGLRATELLVLARLYASISFKGVYDDTLRELSNWNGSTYITAINSMRSLIERGIIVKDGRKYYLSETTKSLIIR